MKKAKSCSSYDGKIRIKTRIKWGKAIRIARRIADFFGKPIEYFCSERLISGGGEKDEQR